ncbi:MAG TPA: hypothetical protein VII02_01920 [Gemmatimonadaceae bacterium]
MSRLKGLAVLSLVCLLGVGACSDATGPTTSVACPITGGSGTCQTR